MGTVWSFWDISATNLLLPAPEESPTACPSAGEPLRHQQRHQLSCLKSKEATLNGTEELKKKNGGAQRKSEFHGKCKTTDDKILQFHLFAWTR